MLALQKCIPGQGADLINLAFVDVPAADEIIVSVEACGICGSDLHAWSGDSAYDFMRLYLPLTLGHEFAGTVLAIGADAAAGPDALRPGDNIVCLPTVTCGDCVACHEGHYSACANRRVIGLHRDGGFAAKVRIPAANALRLPAGLAHDIAALAEPLAVSINAVNTSGLVSSEGNERGRRRVLVLGPGPIGFGIALVAASRGADVMLAGFRDGPRLTLARELGIARTVDLADETLTDAVARHFGQGPDIVLEATGRPSSVAEGLAILRSEGVLVVVGIHDAPLTLDINQLVRGKKQMRGSHDSTRACFQEAVARLAAEPDRYGRMITHRLPLERASEGFALARDRSALKVMLHPAS
ncbi:alcohol dehydrogenase catalytic domain-containing protein [Aureimonas fodinaquatilis]|uniref:Alcohol dehydrogenase catalytic domain-containing protein n=1 Tax=Aureimonas fodinaquatilis TaxID=2565783 RepID=A0A5B0DRL2_9HYPH|nr:alcohol dehydrogenase catalytic domain-containing protein [Aureimonas fodinaquatilis]KAA0969434.1 alcohol dehydrogenase catalytic domain-containing protein [Aureimonas fodinaquatilis]